jgi:hypothetical protein
MNGGGVGLFRSPKGSRSALIGALVVLGARGFPFRSGVGGDVGRAFNQDTPAAIKAQLPPNIPPPWTAGIQPINRENYWNAVACGKQGGERPLCVFYDAALCPNDDYTLAMFTPYKMVAYEVWRAVRQRQEPPTPSYSEAQRTRITVKLTPRPGAKNPLTAFAIKRAAATVKPATQSLDAGGGSFIFDFAPFQPNQPITLEMIGKARTLACILDTAVLAAMR